MRLLTTLLCSMGLVFAQSTAKPVSKMPTIPDKDRADFLLIQRDWITVQRQYEDAFKKEPAVVKLESSVQALQKLCQDSGAQFDQKTVQCVEVPKPATK